MKDKQKLLDKIAHAIQSCNVCKVDKIGNAVPGEGNSNAEIVFIGEAPGKTEAVTGRPFVGRSGKLLRKLIEQAGLKIDDVYITSPVKYLPKYVTPTPNDIKHGRIHLNQQLKIIDPKVIVVLGNVAALALLDEKIMTSKRHGEIIKKERLYFITVHPAAALRFTKMREILLSDFKRLKKIVKLYN